MAAAKSSLSLAKLPVAAKVGVGAAIVFLTAIAYFIIFYSDVSSAIRSARSQETGLRQRLADARKAEYAYHQDLAELTDRQQRQREFNKILPESTEYPAFLSAVQGVANVSGVDLQAWSPVEESMQQFYAKVPMKLKIVGKFHQIAKFFYGIGQLDRIINIEDISMKDPKFDGDEVTVKVECMATAFRSLGGKTTGTPAAPGAPAGSGAPAAPAPPASGGK
ncbi:MAG: type 4a pilus biogenesis protein PilO [Deltaproteobacteria bacterium]|nr:type 4a pilus biogenesis protein PilO [Deltaproteobacteria bacterium]